MTQLGGHPAAFQMAPTNRSGNCVNLSASTLVLDVKNHVFVFHQFLVEMMGKLMLPPGWFWALESIQWPNGCANYLKKIKHCFQSSM